MTRIHWLLQQRLAGFAFTILALGGSAFAQEYKVRLAPAQKVGDKYSISCTVNGKNTISADLPNAQPQHQSFDIDLDGTIEVQAVDDASGQPAKIACTVTKATRDGQQLYDPGTVITVERKDHKPQLTVNGQAIDQQTSEQLGAILNVHDPGSPTDDEMFGTEEPKKVGDSWPVNKEAVAKSLSQEAGGLPIDKNDVDGTAKLVGVKTVHGKDYLQIESQVQVKNVHGQVPGGNINDGSFDGQMNAQVAADGQSHGLGSSMTLKIEMSSRVTGPNGQEVGVKLSMDRKVKESVSDAK